jgi:hypothetical protein
VEGRGGRIEGYKRRGAREEKGAQAEKKWGMKGKGP